jgi:hypothetical protein
MSVISYNNVVFFLLGDSPASEFYVPTFWNPENRLLASCALQYCYHHSVVTTRLTSQWPGSVILSQTHSLCWEYIHSLGHYECYWHKQKMLSGACVASNLTNLLLHLWASKLKVLNKMFLGREPHQGVKVRQHFRDWLHPCVPWTWRQSQ